MTRFRRTPLAWKNLTHNIRRLLVAVSGVTFAVVLMFMERGFQNALFDSTVALVRTLDADIVMISRSRYSLSSSSRFPASKIRLALSCDGVETASPMYIENYMAILRRPGYRSRPIRVVGLDVRQKVFTDDLDRILAGYRDGLLAPRTALIDTRSKTNIYEEIDPNLPSHETTVNVELANKNLQLIGNFQLGTDFANDGTLVMNLENFAFYFPLREVPRDPLSTVDLGLVVCRQGEDPNQVTRRLQQVVGSEVDVFTREDFVSKEIKFWDDNTPIGAIFKVGMIMGFVVGILICYQVLYNDIADHMPEFATLMAMGYSGRYFISLVVREAVYLSLFGFIPGMCISWLLFQLITVWTGLTMSLSLWDIGLTLTFTLVMCTLSGLLAVRKLLAADPASLF